MLPPLLSIETFTGQPIKFNGAELRLRSQVIRLRFPFISGGVIWNRPVGVSVRTAAGQDHIVPVRDVTRTTVLTLLALSLAGIFLLMVSRRK